LCPGAATYVVNAPTPGGGYTAEATFGVKGDVVIAITLSHPGGSNLQIPESLMQQQYAKL
jgi:hypothetical protein